MSLTKLRKMQWNLKHKLKNNRGKTSKISHDDRKGGFSGEGALIACLSIYTRYIYESSKVVCHEVLGASLSFQE